MNFIAHNIDLGKGKFILPESVPVLESTERWQAIERTIRLVFRPEEIPTLRVVDLGCLDGGYSVAFARLGMQVTGMDARESNIEKCEWVNSHLKLPNLSFVTDDVKNLANYEQFDVIFCAGLLYHLDEPSAFIKLMHERSRKLTIIHTHYSLQRDSFYDNPRLSFVQRAAKKVFNLPNYHYSQKYDYRLSEIVEHEGYKGRWFHEFSADSSKKAIENHSEASYSNYKSFWHTKPEILRCFRDAGYRIIYEQFDFIGKYTGMDYTEKHDRGMFVLLR